MTVDINKLKTLISQTRPQNLLVLSVNKLEKDSTKSVLNQIESFIKKDVDYVVMVVRK